MCKIREAKKEMNQIQVDGVIVQDPREIKLVVFNHFNSFFKKGQQVNAAFKCQNLAKLGAENRAMFEKKFSEEEIWEAIKSCDGNKAPGPDDFNLNFFKEFWSKIKGDIVKVFDDFFEHGKLVRGLNAAFNTLIPKSSNPTSFSDYRPISLIGGVYKLIAKVLANDFNSLYMP